ncbi:MAG: multiheme c-type cytochrome [Gemmataceae bacterium]
MNDTPSPFRRVLMWFCAAVLITGSGWAGLALARWLRPTMIAADLSAPKFPGRLFEGWKKPDVTLVFTGQQYGYLLPCGCSDPQIGGLERRYNLIQMLREAGWNPVPIDLGDVPQTAGPAYLPNQQGVLKYVYAMKAMREMNYIGVGIGKQEATLGFMTLLSEYSLNNPKPPVLISNLIDAEKNFPELTKPWNWIDTPSGVRVGVTAVVGSKMVPSIKEVTQADPTIRFSVVPETLENVLKQMTAGKVTLPVLLYQGHLGKGTPPTEAMQCAEAFPQFPVVLCLSEDEEPAQKPTMVRTKAGETLILQLGKKGKFVGVVGAWKTANGYDFKVEMVEMNPEFKTPEDKRASHPIVKLMEEYTTELKAKDYLSKYSPMRHPLQILPEVEGLRNPGEPQYVGSEACKKCHEDAYDIWKKSEHAHAYETLEKVKYPGNRNYDPECIVCHTVGFGYKSGYENAVKTPKLKDVGCESCHGPASLHVRNPNNIEWQKRVNPWRHLPVSRDKQILAMDLMCQKCHDAENDVTWTNGGFKRKWPKVEHPTPRLPEDEEKPKD